MKEFQPTMNLIKKDGSIKRILQIARETGSARDMFPLSTMPLMKMPGKVFGT
ncbi:hypothetical protein D3C83_287580 [compost metagenome]